MAAGFDPEAFQQALVQIAAATQQAASAAQSAAQAVTSAQAAAASGSPTTAAQSNVRQMLTGQSYSTSLQFLVRANQ